MSTFFRFALVGLVGFCVDFLAFKLFFFLSLPVAVVRILSWVCAVIVTYYGNSMLTFPRLSDATLLPMENHSCYFPRGKGSLMRRFKKVFYWSGQKFLLYLSSQLMGGILNISAFSLVYFMVFNRHNEFIAFVIGASLGLLANYLGARFVLSGSRNKIA